MDMVLKLAKVHGTPGYTHAYIMSYDQHDKIQERSVFIKTKVSTEDFGR